MVEAALTPPVCVPPSQEDIHNSEQMIRSLRKRELPQMVNWWDASILAMVGVRNMISATIGSYADQRPMQAAADNGPEAELTSRHDYRQVFNGGKGATRDLDGRWSVHATDEAGLDASKSLAFDTDGGLWVDFIADLGDGFEASYSMAYLMAQPSISLKNPDKADKSPNLELPAGEIMIMGGDMAYPNATIKEYRARCIEPYDAAFQLKEGQPVKRKLFFIAGNHDWYDGLAAFTSVFCTARDRLAQGKGVKVGGWQAEQRRSYFALALPHGWWFWGIDLALNETIDDAQKNYFEAMSLQTKPGEKIIIILHAPVWQTNDNSPLHEVSQWARKQGAEVVCLIAGDLHFYSRFHSLGREKIADWENALPQDLQLITSGGGGAFLHPTHQLPREMAVHWTVPKDKVPPHLLKDDFKDTITTVTASDEPTFQKSKGYQFHAPHIYPSKSRSMLLALKNLWLPFHNRKFATFMGVFYLVFAWVFQIATQDPTDTTRRSQMVNIDQWCSFYHPRGAAPSGATDPMREKCKSDGKIAFERKGAGAQTASAKPIQVASPDQMAAELILKQEKIDAQKMEYARVAQVNVDIHKTGDRLTEFPGKQLVRAITAVYPVIGPHPDKVLAFATWFEELQHGGGWDALARDFIWPAINTERTIFAMLSNPAFFFMIIGLYLGLIYYVGFEDREFVKPTWLKWPVKIAVGGLHAWLHVVVLLGINTLLQPLYAHFTQDGVTWPWMIGGVALYSLLMVLIGGLIGGMLFGLYWVLTSLIGRLHMDSFGALGIPGYKNFLRMRIEPDKLTIYPIGLDKVPGRKGWRALTKNDDASGHNPLIKPIFDLRPHLIEPPIEVLAPALRGRVVRA